MSYLKSQKVTCVLIRVMVSQRMYIQHSRLAREKESTVNSRVVIIDLSLHQIWCPGLIFVCGNSLTHNEPGVGVVRILDRFEIRFLQPRASKWRLSTTEIAVSA
eukprot:870337-Rhodomonas_salina.2